MTLDPGDNLNILLPSVDVEHLHYSPVSFVDTSAYLERNDVVWERFTSLKGFNDVNEVLAEVNIDIFPRQRLTIQYKDHPAILRNGWIVLCDSMESQLKMVSAG